MKLYKKIQELLERVVGPIATAIGKNKYISSISEAFLYTMPITLGVAVITVLANIPIDPWTNFLHSTGLYNVAIEISSLTLSLLAIYVVGAIGYCFTRNEKENGYIGAIIAMASFITLMPTESIDLGDGMFASALLTSYMGSDGIFVAIIIGLLIPALYCKLMKKNLKLNLPDGVPPMVSQSLSPTLVSMIIFTLLFFIKYGVSLTSYGNVFTMISTIIGEPITRFGATPLSLVIVYTLINLFWFFGIHPNAILSCYLPVIIAASMANIEAFLAGQPQPSLILMIMWYCVAIGGTGNTMGLCIATLFAKSEKYKSMRKLVIPANIFNINEPIIFGFPVMLNPVYFFPMVCSPAASGGIAYLLCKILPIAYNPTVEMPWVTPGFVSAFVQGGIWFLVIWIVCLLIHFIMYLPFFLIDDKNALKMEQENQM